MKRTIIQLNEQMKKIAGDFFFAQKKLRLKRLEEKFSSGKEDNDSIYILVIEKVRRAFEKLSEEDKRIINNDYFFQSYPYWWMEGYSRSSYYRHKKIAILNFIRAYESN